MFVLQKEKAPIGLYFLLIAVMASWGFNVTMTKVLVSYFPTVTMTSFRIFTAAITVIIILFITKKLRLPTKQEFGLILLASIFNIVIHHFFLSNGLKLTTGTNAGLILGSAPIVVAIFFCNFSPRTNWCMAGARLFSRDFWREFGCSF